MKRAVINHPLPLRPALCATLLLLLAAMLVSVLGGCAGTARGVKHSTYAHDPSVAPVDVSHSRADAMVIIRYPAVLDENALPAFSAAFEQHAIGGKAKLGEESRLEIDRLAESLIAKSNFYSMSLYRELRDELGADAVLLSPHLVELDDAGHLVSRPLLASEQVPSVITIDFSVYSFPDTDEMMSSEPLTFGDLVTPLFVIHANRWLRPSTHGLLLSSDALLSSAWVESRRQADEQLRSRYEDRLPDYVRPLAFVAYLDAGAPDPGRLPVKNPGQSRRDVVAVESYVLEKIQMDGDLVDSWAIDGSIDPFAEEFVKGAATRVVTALNRVDHDRATFFTRQVALSQFDPELGRALLSREFLAAQSASLYEGVYAGIYGAEMRQMITAEYRLLEERRDLAVKQNLGTAVAILAMAGAVAIGNDVDSSNFFESSTMSNILALSSVWAMNTAFVAHAQSKTIGENFLAQMAPAINNQVSVQVEWLESREQITASDFGTFREQALALYQRSVRSVPVAAEIDCSFVHPMATQAGRWLGPCRDGLAIGTGYGLLLDASGLGVEYVGAAQDGLADGTGAMIVRIPGKAGATYYSGSFAVGLPDGVVQVEEPGKRPRVRSYRAGRDAGAANADDLQRVTF